MKLIARVANTPEGLQAIKDMREVAKSYGMKLAVYGRAPRKKVFAITGRPYMKYRGGNGNNISLKSKEAPYCYEWVVYRLDTEVDRDIRRKEYDISKMVWMRNLEVRKVKK